MNRRPFVARAVLAAAGLFAAGAVVGFVATPAQADGTAPPWAPNGVSQDQNALGGLTFYDASGKVIKQGSTIDQPFAKYAVGSKGLRADDSTATLYGYIPQVGLTPDNWHTNEQIGGSPNYPDANAPAPVKTASPEYTGAADDESLATMTSDIQNTSTEAGYQNVYEIRMYTSAPHKTVTLGYDYADIAIDNTAHTWTLVWSPATSTAVKDPSALSISAPGSVRFRGAATVSGKLTDAKTHANLGGQTVQLRHRGNAKAAWHNLRTVKTGPGGMATFRLSPPTANDQYDLFYAGDATHAAVTSGVRIVNVSQTIVIHTTASKVKHGRTVRIYGGVSQAGVGGRVRLQILSGKTWRTTSLSAAVKRQKLPNRVTTSGYVISLKLGSRGSHLYRVYKPATAKNTAGYSGVIREQAT